MRLAPKLCLSACALIAVIAPNAQTLSDQVTVTSLSGPTYIYEANKTITTNGTVTATSGTTVSFVAGTQITLSNGFHAAAGSQFHAAIAQPDYSVTLSPTDPPVTSGFQIAYTVSVYSLFGFSGTVYFSSASIIGGPSGLVTSFSQQSVTVSPDHPAYATLNVTPANIPAGNYTLTVVTASLGYPNHDATAQISIEDFLLTVSPASASINTGGTAPYSVGVTALNGFTGTVNLSVQLSGSGSYSFSPSSSIPVGSSATLTITAGSSPGVITATVSGYSGGKTHSAPPVTVNVSQAANPLTVSCIAPSSATTGTQVTFAANANSPISTYNWSYTVSGTGSSASFTPTTPGTYIEYLSITDTSNRTATTSCQVVVTQGTTALTITSSTALPQATTAAGYSTQLTASGGSGSYTWSAAYPLPNINLTLYSNGQFSGTPNAAGTYALYFTVTDGASSVTSQFWLTVISGTPQSSIQVSQAYPQITGAPAADPHTFTFHFTDPLGPSDIAGGQIVFNNDTNGPDSPICEVDWTLQGSALNINGSAYSSFGSGAVISNSFCTVYTGSSTLTQAAQGYDVSVLMSFPQPLLTALVTTWARGTTVPGNTGAYSPVGSHAAARLTQASGDDGDYGDDESYLPIILLDSLPFPPPAKTHLSWTPHGRLPPEPLL